MKNETGGKGISLLNFDGTLQRQPLLRKYPYEWIDFSDLRGCHGFCGEEAMRKIQDRLKARKHKNITLIGNGNYHYVTYLLLKEIRQPFSLILFDHHTDLAPGGDIPCISCGSWVSEALKRLPYLNRVFIIGARTPDSREASGMPAGVTIITEEEIGRLSAADIVRAIRSALPDQPIYISVDKDVLDRGNAVTNWDQGSMKLQQLVDVLRELKRTLAIAGVDVCGEWPLSPVEQLSAEQMRRVKKNEIANKAIVDTLLAG